MTTELSESFAQAEKYVSEAHNAIVRMRDELDGQSRKALAAGDVAHALGLREKVARYEGEIEGLAVASAQLRMVRKRA